MVTFLCSVQSFAVWALSVESQYQCKTTGGSFHFRREINFEGSDKKAKNANGFPDKRKTKKITGY